MTTTLRERTGGGGSKKEEDMRRGKSLCQAGAAIAFKAPTMVMALGSALLNVTFPGLAWID